MKRKISSGIEQRNMQKEEEMLGAGTVIGLPVTAGTPGAMVDAIIDQARNRVGGYVCVANAHMLVTARRRRDLHLVLEGANYVTSDGMPLVWALRNQGFRDAERVCGTDLMLRLCKSSAEKKIGLYLFGGDIETLRRLESTLLSYFPNVSIKGYEAPPLLPERPKAHTEVVRRIQSSGANIVLVSLGCPKQEYWMAAYSRHLDAVLLGVGAAFDFLAGNKLRAPCWMQKCGLEWLFRLAVEPRRLWRRYAYINILFLSYYVQEIYRQYISYPLGRMFGKRSIY